VRRSMIPDIIAWVYAVALRGRIDKDRPGYGPDVSLSVSFFGTDSYLLIYYNGHSTDVASDMKTMTIDKTMIPYKF
jgi:hypothetical protein